jgi:hypothetical protein
VVGDILLERVRNLNQFFRRCDAFLSGINRQILDQIIMRIKRASGQSAPECLELLGEFIRTFQSIPQRYCLFCEANAGLGIEAHRPDCPLRSASELVKTSQSAPQ